MFEQRLVQLDHEIAKSQTASDEQREIAAYRKKIFLNLLSFNLPAMLEASAKLAALTKGKGKEYELSAQISCSLGKQLARWRSQRHTARKLLNLAATMYRDTGDRAGEAEALRTLARLDAAEDSV